MLTADGGLVAPHAPAVDVHPLPAARHTGRAGRPGGGVRQGPHSCASGGAAPGGGGRPGVVGGRGCSRGGPTRLEGEARGEPALNCTEQHTWRGGPGPGLSAASLVRTLVTVSRSSLFAETKWASLLSCTLPLTLQASLTAGLESPSRARAHPWPQRCGL